MTRANVNDRHRRAARLPAPLRSARERPRAAPAPAGDLAGARSGWRDGWVRVASWRTGRTACSCVACHLRSHIALASGVW